MTLKTIRRAALGVAVAFATATALTACSGSGATHTADLTAEMLATCPDAGIATTVGVDATASNISEVMKTANLAVITSHVARTALCGGGHVSVFAFASS